MGSSAGQEGHSLHNQWKALTIETEQRKKCKRTCWQSFTLKVIRMVGSLRVFSKPTACLPPSGVMKESIISTPSWGKQRKRGREAGGQAFSTSVRTEIRSWCTAAVMNSAAHWSQAPSLSLYLSLHRGLRTHTHTCIACSHLQPLNAEEHCLNVIATAPLQPNLTFIMCRLCYKELFACIL